MALRMMARRLVNPSGEALLARSFVRREMSSGDGRVFHDEEKAAENIYIKVRFRFGRSFHDESSIS